MAGMSTWLAEKIAEFKAWPGVESMLFAKINDWAIMSVVVYESREAMDKNADRFKAAVAEVSGKYISTVTRSIGEVIAD